MTKTIGLLSALVVVLCADLGNTQPIPSQANAPQPVNLPAIQGTSDDPMVSYRAYSSAVEAGNFDQAAVHGLEAWRQAEAKWGGANPNTAGLAYNAAWSGALVSKASERVDAARRAVELAPQARGSYSLAEANFLLAYTEYFAAKPADRPNLSAKLAAAAQPVESSWNDFLVAHALVQALANGMNNARPRISFDLAQRALAVIDRVTPTDTNARAVTLLSRGQARLQGGFDREEAIADLVQARVAYGPMRQTDDLVWGTLGAWEAAARAVVVTQEGFDRSETGTRITRISRRPVEMTAAEQKNRSKTCWVRRFGL
ncbi:MAG: hypothetical protein HC777_03465 [Hyphomonadaceae bacterium]|nr:hypothetical protein [Hyphomonadaceae bacterium]